MRDLMLWGVILWAGLAILLHLGLIGYATIYRRSSWWESPWGTWGERLRQILAIIISGLFLAALLTSCACKPSADPARLERRIQTPIPASVADLGIAINCAWSF